MNETEIITVFEASDRWEAELVCGWLHDAGIAATVESNAVQTFVGAPAPSWAEVQVPASYADDARAVIAEMTAPPADERAESGQDPEAADEGAA